MAANQNLLQFTGGKPQGIGALGTIGGLPYSPYVPERTWEI